MRALPHMIALYSPLPGMGKSTASDFLVERFGYKRVKFAEGVKAICRVMLSEIGVPDSRIADYLDGSKKECDLGDYGFSTLSSRKIQQAAGTEFGRDALDKDLWVQLAMGKAARIIDNRGRVVIDDMRFLNEYEAVGWLGAQRWRIERPIATTFTAGNHRSEGGLEGRAFDARFSNDGSIADFHQAIERALA